MLTRLSRLFAREIRPRVVQGQTVDFGSAMALKSSPLRAVRGHTVDFGSAMALKSGPRKAKARDTARTIQGGPDPKVDIVTVRGSPEAFRSTLRSTLSQSGVLTIQGGPNRKSQPVSSIKVMGSDKPSVAVLCQTMRCCQSQSQTRPERSRGATAPDHRQKD